MATTPNLSMVLPVPGTTGALGTVGAGLSWLELLNAALSRLDGHTHAPGSGAAVPSAGISINGDLPFGAHNATALRSARFTPISLGALVAADLGALVVSGSDLYYVDTSGNQVRLTSGGALAGTPGSIGGLASPAAVSYTPVSKLFDFTSQSGIRAYLNAGPVSIYDPRAGGKYAQIKVPVGLTANYAVTLPSALPGSTLALLMDATGAISTAPSAYAPLASPTFTGTVDVSGALTVGGASDFTGTITLHGSPAGAHVVTNGDGVGQATNNQIKIGHGSAGQPKVSVDASDFGYLGTTAGLGGAFLVAGRVTGATGAIAAQTGTITATSAHPGTGAYTISVTGLTTAGIVLVTGVAVPGYPSYTFVSQINSGNFQVATGYAAGTAADSDFTFVVLKL